MRLTTFVTPRPYASEPRWNTLLKRLKKRPNTRSIARVSQSFGSSWPLSSSAASAGDKRQRVERGDHRRDRDGHRELLVELARSGRHERERHEHGDERQRDGDDRPADFPHRLIGSLPRRQPVSIFRSTFSTTTIASSTTMPIASTMPNNDSALIEKPNASSSENVPMIDTGTAEQRNDRRAPRLQEHDHDQHDERDRLEQRVDHRLDTGAHELRRVVDDLVLRRLSGMSAFSSFIVSRTWSEICSEFAPGSWLIAIATADLLSSNERSAVFRCAPVRRARRP